MTDAFTKESVAYWAQVFQGSSVGIVPFGSLHATREAGLQLESGGEIDLKTATFRAVRHDRHPMGRWVDLVAPNAVRPTRATITIPGPAPKYGADTRDILMRVGFNDAQIARMINNGAASAGWSEKYLPE